MRMMPFKLIKDGFSLRALACPKCNDKTIHPKDEQDYRDFVNLKNKQFNVKMRFVGNSYAVSIPKEIVNFMKEQEKIIDDMVSLCFEESGRISLKFCNYNSEDKFSNQINKEI